MKSFYLGCRDLCSAQSLTALPLTFSQSELELICFVLSWHQNSLDSPVLHSTPPQIITIGSLVLYKPRVARICFVETVIGGEVPPHKIHEYLTRDSKDLSYISDNTEKQLTCQNPTIVFMSLSGARLMWDTEPSSKALRSPAAVAFHHKASTLTF